MITLFRLCLLYFYFLSTPGLAQKTSLYLQGQYNHTLSDKTELNNPLGMGLGLQFFYNASSRLKPILDLTADAYLENIKVLTLTENGLPENDVRSMINVFAGGGFHLSEQVYLSAVGGPSFLGGQVKFGIKPSLGFYFSNQQKWMGKISYIAILNRDEVTKNDFTSVSLGLGVRLF